MSKKMVLRNARPAKGLPRVGAPTLADVVIRWREGDDVREMSGADVAWLVQYARERHPCATGRLFDMQSESLRVVATLRGLGGILFPDAGTPHPDLEADERFAVSEILNELAATVGADGMSAESAKRFQIVPATKAPR